MLGSRSISTTEVLDKAVCQQVYIMHARNGCTAWLTTHTGSLLRAPVFQAPGKVVTVVDVEKSSKQLLVHYFPKAENLHQARAFAVTWMNRLDTMHSNQLFLTHAGTCVSLVHFRFAFNTALSVLLHTTPSSAARVPRKHAW